MSIHGKERNGCDWDRYTCSLAARSSHIEVLKWLPGKENKCSCGGDLLCHKE